MKLLLISLLAPFALPNSLNAESHWLIIRATSYGDGNAFEKIEMESAEACDEEGKRWIYSQTDNVFKNKAKFYHCVVCK